MHQWVADAKVDAEPLQQKAANERSGEPGDHILKKTRSADEPACDPACQDTNSHLGGDGTFVERSEGLMINADADR